MNLKAQRAAAIKAALDIIQKAKDENRDLSTAEITDVEAKHKEIADLTVQIDRAEKSGELMRQIEAFGGDVDRKGGDERPAKSIGEHFLKSLNGRSLKSLGNFVTPEFKAATDTQATGTAYGNFATTIDTSFVMPYQRRLVVADLLGSGVVSGNAVTYPVFGALEGSTSTVAQGGAKPQIHVADPTWVTDALGEVAGFFKLTDDMAEDLPYVVSEIEGTARYDLLTREEEQILSGNGTAPNLRGLLNRSGVQTSTKGTDTTADAIFKTFALISNATGFVADGIIINPTDYQALRLAKDSNGQYYGGGFFIGSYGQGGLRMEPPIWGVPTVVTPAVAAGTVVVGAFQGTSKVLRKGGLRVESTNSHSDDFTNDKITVRLKERLGLQAKYPAAVVSLNLGA